MSLSRTAPSVDRSVSLPDLIGNTPLLRLDRISQHLPNVRLLAKAEWFNPGGSVKDRPALRMLRRGEDEGALTPGKTILEATSGNTGIAFAMLGAALGYPVTVCLPANASAERKRILRAYGAEIIETSALELTDGAIAEARRLHEETPGKYFYPDQIQQRRELAGALSHDRARDLGADRRRGHPLRVRSRHERHVRRDVTKAEGARPVGAVHLGAAGRSAPRTRRLEAHAVEHRSRNLRPYDRRCRAKLATEDAHAMMARLAREEGLIVSASSSGALVAALEVAEDIERGLVVTVFPDRRGFHDTAA